MTRLPPLRITADTWDPVGKITERHGHAWQIRGVLVPGGDHHWRLARRHPVPPGAVAYGVDRVEVWEGYARPQTVAAWLDQQERAWRRWQQQTPRHHQP